jgi:UDP-N-acetylmuramoylalanine--D-glutamate ligase
VIGLGVSGFSVADTLAELGAHQIVVAEKADPELVDILDVIGVAHVIGKEAAGIPQHLIDLDPELIITSPGVRPDAEIIQWANARNIPIWVDIELAWRIRDKAALTAGAPIAEWLCITGTNGKTTTTQLTEKMLLTQGLRAASCGNIGTPILDVVRDPIGFEVLVVELSSFQLHYLGEISPWSSAVLNIADDHLDWHGSFDEYSRVKGKAYHQVKNACVYNVADKATERLVELADVVEGARAIGFTLGIPSKSQVGYVEDILCDRAFLEERDQNALEIATLAEISQIGEVTPHLLANVAAATALARSVGVEPQVIATAIANFKMDGHRIELVGESQGIRWFDDSKATNPHAAEASLSAFENVVWIVGGLLKGVDLRDLISKAAGKLRAALVIGAESTEVLETFAAVAPNVKVIEVDASSNDRVMTRAVELAAQNAVAGDTVLLAPAAASMDQFKDYADRGNQFAAAVKAHLSQQGGIEID